MGAVGALAAGCKVAVRSVHARPCLAIKALASSPAAARSPPYGEARRARMPLSLARSRGVSAWCPAQA